MVNIPESKQLYQKGTRCRCETHCNNSYNQSFNRYSHFTGEGNGTLLQYSCLENPMDGGAG